MQEWSGLYLQIVNQFKKQLVHMTCGIRDQKHTYQQTPYRDPYYNIVWLNLPQDVVGLKAKILLTRTLAESDMLKSIRITKAN
jgi:hypothetical protein